MSGRVDQGIAHFRSLLPEKARRYLDGDERHPNGSWATLRALARYCHTAGMDGFEFRELIEWSDFGSSSLFGKGRLKAQCSKAWNKTDDDSYSADSIEIRLMVRKLQERVAAHRFPGRAGSTDQTVALAVLARCHELGAYTPVLSCRWLAEQTSLGNMTVHRSLRRLRETHGLLVGKPRITDRWNYQYRINLRWNDGLSGTSNLVPSTCITYGFINHDVFTSRALGQRARRIWVSTSKPSTAAEVAAAHSMSVETARKDLNTLVEFGLASRSKAGRSWIYTMTDVDVSRLDELAKWFGTDGWHERQAEIHARHRDARRKHFTNRK